MALYRRGTIWWYEFGFDGRRIRESTKIESKTLARAAEEKRKLELRERRAGIARPARPLRFEEFLKTFLAWSEKQHRPKTHDLHALNCDVLKRYFAGKWLDEITAGMIEEFKLARARETRRNARAKAVDSRLVGSATVNRALTTLKLLFRQAANHWPALANPAARVALLPESAGRTRVITTEEERKYLEAAGEPLGTIARVILDTGMRPEDVYRLEVADLDLEHFTIAIPRGKTPAARRAVPMTQRVWHLLKERAKAARGRYLFPSRWDLNRPMGSVRKAHDQAIARAGITEHFRLYDLRHTFASRAAAAGMESFRLARQLGHTKLQMTARYVHVSLEDLKRALAEREEFERKEQEKRAKIGEESPQKSPHSVN